MSVVLSLGAFTLMFDQLHFPILQASISTKASDTKVYATLGTWRKGTYTITGS